MSMHKKMVEQMRQGALMERDRVMRCIVEIAISTRQGLDKKLMTAGEKHVAELRFKIAEGVLAALQMMVMSGEDPNAKETTTDILGSDGDAVGGAQGDPDRPGAG